VLVSDYGLGLAADAALRETLASLPAHVPIVWDPHRVGSDPVPGVAVVTPNRTEALAFSARRCDYDLRSLTELARELRRLWRAVNICITLGADGVLLEGGAGPPLSVPAPRISGGDPCGAGDRFASYVAGLLADGDLVIEAVTAAVGPATAFVQAGGAAGALKQSAEERVRGRRAAASRHRAAEAGDVVARVRAAGGTVVCAGGCFDILHAGHVRMLEAARALGDCLVVCLNSDESVRRLKGPGRPVVSEPDRVAVLQALECVDAVAPFEEDTPAEVLERLRPDLFAKGGDYANVELPEASVLERWGGQAVTVPYIPGRSTTRLIEELAYFDS
jgi:D-beta-D-heptose 7-phosphate kinase / D-beta-D-heptose 1-phosphate adenosyltransferase